MPSIASSHKSRVCFVVTLLAMTAFLSLLSISPTPVHAQATSFQELQPNLKINIPTLTPFSKIAKPDEQGFIYVSYLAEYISAVYQYVVGIAGIFAVALIMWGGMKWIFAGGDAAKVTSARKTINNAVIGLVLALGSYLLLYTINPETIRFRALSLYAIPREELRGQEEVWDAAEGLGAGPVGDLKQGDSRWAAVTYTYPTTNCTNQNPSPEQQRAQPCAKGSGTICSSGCGPTSAATVLSSYGVNVTPAETAQFAVASGARKCNGTDMSEFMNKLNQSPWSNFRGERINLDRATELLSQNKPIIFLCKGCMGTTASGATKSYKGHFMTLAGVSGDTYTVKDPGSRVNGIVSITRAGLAGNAGFWYLHP